MTLSRGMNCMCVHFCDRRKMAAVCTYRNINNTQITLLKSKLLWSTFQVDFVFMNLHICNLR